MTILNGSDIYVFNVHGMKARTSVSRDLKTTQKTMSAVEEDKSVKCQPTLYGDLDLTIIAAQLSKTDVFSKHPYVTVVVLEETVARTRVWKETHSPDWQERFVIPLAHALVNIEFRVKNDRSIGTKLIATAKIPASQIATGYRIDGWFPIMNAKGRLPYPDAAIHLRMKFTPCEQNPLYREGVAGDPEQSGVRSAYFPLRKRCQLTLYQDAHMKVGLLEDHKMNTCWEDLCYFIWEAKHLVYIIGWSVFHKIKLVREPTRELPCGRDLTLGELLKQKSEQGVKILLLLWKDGTGGVMKTHDKETQKFFKHSSVKCVLASRNASRYAINNCGIFQKQVLGTMFSHHQKCVIVDTEALGNHRKITSFIGGFDLCDGRYDTPEHRLFGDLNTVFEGDFHNPTYPSTLRSPRQPWHDLHCRVDGPAAVDALINFEQLWRKLVKVEKFNWKCKNVSHCCEDFLIKTECIPQILCPKLSSTKDGTTIVPIDDRIVQVFDENNPENWHVQIFRSIDSGSVQGFPKSINISDKKQNLLYAKDLVIEKSIQAAYIQSIRSAQHYIYIETQYFVGSSYAWPSYKNAGANNPIPIELALKIASKIKAKERFAVYVVMPMWPEGDPNSKIVQAILFWQMQTIWTMYDIVAKALKEKQMDSHPQDYLNFYCLGNRELPEDASNADDAKVSNSQKNQRFMIYVHAKAMIVDDEYLIVGSANLNERSMAGTRDTEIAMGAYQPHHRWANKKHPFGQVYEYRMSLWREHLGVLDRHFEEPESLECVKRVNEIADDNWKRYTATDFTLLQGHLLKYPLRIDADGKVESLPGHENFPDVGGSVIGAPTVLLPDVLTT